MTPKTRKSHTRRDRHKAKQSGYAREPGKRVGHHHYEAKYFKGAKIPT